LAIVVSMLAMGFALTSALVAKAPLVAPPQHLSRAALLRTAASAALALPLGARAVEAPPPFEVGTKEAFAAFAAGEYTRAEQLSSRAAEAYPDSALAFANLATLLIINASDKMTLGELPTGEALQRLERALVAIDRAEALGASAPRPDQPVGRGADAVLLNSRGNALGLLQRWPEAQEAYTTSADSAVKSFASIPRSNAALVAFERGQYEQAERQARQP
jgi:tetratricopeptide (TPR) repeat protein